MEPGRGVALIMLMLLSLAVIALIAYTQVREGIVGAFGTCVATVIAGMLAFEFWPMLAWEVQSVTSDTFLEQMEDAIVLTLVFGILVAIIRIGVASMTRNDFGFSPKVDQIGGGIFGLITGYLVSGFLVCVLQTMPWHEHFFGFEYDDSGLSPRLLPADQVWLKLMLQENKGAFSPGGDDDTKAAGEKTISEFSKVFGHERRYNENRTKPPTPPPAPPAPPKEKDKDSQKDKDKDQKDKKDKDKDKKDKKGDNKESSTRRESPSGRP